MKRSYWIAIALIIIVVAAVGGYYYTTLPPPTEEEEKFKIALVLWGPKLDGSWNEFWFEAASDIAQTHDWIELTIEEFVLVPDYERVVGALCAKGYDYIIGTTPDYQDASLTLGDQYPDTFFTNQGGWLNNSRNVASMNVWPNEGSYLAGYLAGLMTDTNVVAVVGAFTYPSQVSAHQGFMAGAEAANPAVTARESFMGSWTDTAKARDHTDAMIDLGADILYFSVSGAAFGGIPRCDARGVKAIGAFLDLNHLAPTTVLTSNLWKPKAGIQQVIWDIRNGTFKMDYAFFLRHGFNELAPHRGNVPDDIWNQVKQVEQDIIDGTIVVPLVKEQP